MLIIYRRTILDREQYDHRVCYETSPLVFSIIVFDYLSYLLGPSTPS